MGKTGGDICPTSGRNIISTLKVKAERNVSFPVALDPTDFFYDLQFLGSGASTEISFKLDNPFDFSVGMFIQYLNRPTGSTHGALETNCVGDPITSSCNPASLPIKAGCISAGVQVPYTLVSVFFISQNPIFGGGGLNVKPYECCPIPAAEDGKPIVQYTFRIECGCP